MTRSRIETTLFLNGTYRSTWRWLQLLYCQPFRLITAIAPLPSKSQLAVALRLWLHSFPFSVMICTLVRSVLYTLVPFDNEVQAAGATDLLVVHLQMAVVGIGIGIAFGLLLGIAFILGIGVTYGVAVGVIFGLTFGMAFGMGFGLPKGIAAQMVFGFAFGIAFGGGFGIAQGMGKTVPGRTMSWIVGGILVGIAGGVGFGIAVGITGGITAAFVSPIVLLRAYYHPIHALFLWPKARGAWYSWHPVSWDDLCSVPFPGLNRLLVAFAEQNPAAGEKEIGRLIDSYPSQRHQALRARATLLARQAARSDRLAALDEVVAGLPEGEKGFLAETSRLREIVHEIAVLQIRLDTIDRPFLREPVAQLLVREIENFGHRVAGFHQPLATEFRAAARQWQERAERQLDEVRAVLRREPTRQVFRAGDPVDRDGEAFVPRHAVLGELERQVMLSTGCPGLVLYGRRRTGKSTVLRNLVGFLPPTVRPVGISMQDPQAYSTLRDLVGHLGREIAGVLPDRDAPTLEDLPALFRFVTEVNEQLADQDQRLLLGLDEYEQIDRKIGEGVFPEDLLATVRESIQSHRHVIWTFAGSHEISELPHAPWTSYLVSARTVEVPPFTAAETRLLLTEPLRHSTLWPRDDPSCPRFAPELWGEGGIEHIHAEAGGWPHLVQLIAEAVVDLLNDEDRSHADPELLERALDKAVVRGHTVFYELMHRESTLAGEWEYLAAFRTRDRQPPSGDDAVVRSLRRRLLVAEEDGEWRLRVPLMQRWLRQRG